MKKLAVIAGGWHYPLHFYKTMEQQKIPSDWKVDLFAIGHRDPDDHKVKKEKDDYLSKFESNNNLIKMDKFLYKKMATKKWFDKSLWNFWIDDNTIGDYAFFNQWSLKYNYLDYDVIFLIHDDNFIVSKNLFVDILTSNSKMYCIKNRQIEKIESDDNWLYIGNGWSPGYYNPRGSFGLFKKELISMIGGNFKIDNIDLMRIGKTETPDNHDDLSDWNQVTKNFIQFMEKKNLLHKMYRLSDLYRVSDYCIECERGYISKARVSTGDYLNGLNKLLQTNNKILNRAIS